ncbi:hypothetical protein ACH46N_05400 [Streptomyces pristinaespiralis]|uniref:Uncharacterized protein n=2 Tax=Streptomyces pristinaespiralis TaxID=38300 RepID=B5H835_STRE2|nr:hypothetical protein [Streptomyces pristinaespiralis]ALC18986.1 hypothetical protein SPRI_0680 [Streptomyces pristinaespiralis]EDY63026.1 conserved hypothetical protein [Streptomyces pristinaespiralis ATCC 25486]QMU17903.1 hypothetical protein H3L99_33565 [Streptomyces pristinaespiralis]
MLDEYASCDIYVDSDDHDLVRRSLSSTLGIKGETRLKVGAVEISIAHNDYETGGEGFLDWWTVIECSATHDAAPKSVVSSVQAVLDALRGSRIRALPSCYFEDELDF